MVTGVPTHLTQAIDGGLLRGSSVGGRPLRECSPGERTGKGSPCSEPDSQEVRQLARELVAEFGREYVLEASLMHSGIDLSVDAQTDGAKDVLGSFQAESLKTSAHRVFEAVESKPREVIPFFTPNPLLSYPSGFSSSPVAQRGTLLSIQV